MTAMQVAQTMTAEEFINLPVPERGRPWNLVDGEVVVNHPTWRHGRIQIGLIVALSDWIREAPARGVINVPVDVRVDDRNVYAPDVLWYAHGRGPDQHARPPAPMPDLAVEVRSPSTWRYDIGAKKSGYEREGLRELWLVDTAADEVLVFRRSTPDHPTFDTALQLGAGDSLASPLLPGLAVALGELFDDS